MVIDQQKKEEIVRYITYLNRSHYPAIKIRDELVGKGIDPNTATSLINEYLRSQANSIGNSIPNNNNSPNFTSNDSVNSSLFNNKNSVPSNRLNNNYNNSQNASVGSSSNIMSKLKDLFNFSSGDERKDRKKKSIFIIIVFLLILCIVAFLVVGYIMSPSEPVEKPTIKKNTTTDPKINRTLINKTDNRTANINNTPKNPPRNNTIIRPPVNKNNSNTNTTVIVEPNLDENTTEVNNTRPSIIDQLNNTIIVPDSADPKPPIDNPDDVPEIIIPPKKEPPKPDLSKALQGYDLEEIKKNTTTEIGLATYAIRIVNTDKNDAMELCSMIETSRVKDNCYSDIAEESIDISICDNVEDLTKRDSCIMHFLNILKDESMCYKISNRWMQQSCLSLQKVDI